jgi:hypothetical protein
MEALSKSHTISPFHDATLWAHHPPHRTGWYNAHAKDTMCTFPEVAAFELGP